MGNITFLVILGIFALGGVSEAQLKVGFYNAVCPQAEGIIEEFVKEHIHNAPSLAPALLRLHFHDCFVRGCDGSVLLNSTKNSKAEKDAAPNMSLRGFGFIEGVKRLLEEECPGVVSCADTLALVAREAVSVIGGPHWTVPTGRRDGTVSLASDALTNLPSPTANLTSLKANFARKGFSSKDLVVLSGAHTIGITHCDAVNKRLYNFTGKLDQDPSIDKYYAAHLREKCKTPADAEKIVEMDPGSFLTFDTHYYTNVVKRRGLFSSDSALLADPFTRSFLFDLISGAKNFIHEFALSMEKMNRIEVKTGGEGEVRKVCSVVNSY